MTHNTTPDLPETKLILEILEELQRARAKFPGENVNFHALVEEVGELSTALFEEPATNVRKEAVQVAVMACRIALEGDATLNHWRAKKGLDAHPTIAPGEPTDEFIFGDAR